MAIPSKQGFPWIDGQFLNQYLTFDPPRVQKQLENVNMAGPPQVVIVAAHDERDGEIRIRVRRLGTHAETNEVEIGLSKDGNLTSFDHYDS